MRILLLFMMSCAMSAQVALVKNINTNVDDQGVPDGSNINDLFVYNGNLFFRADDGSTGNEFWTSDGTEAGTLLLKDINTDPNVSSGSSNPTDFIEYNGMMYFKAKDATNGSELWQSDGTEAGTLMVQDVNPGDQNGNPRNMTVYGDLLMFEANNGTDGAELWKYDGSSASMVYNADGGPGSSSIIQMIVNGSELYMRQLTLNINGFELRKSDGTEAGSGMVKDVNPGSGHGCVGELAVLNNNVFFEGDANDGNGDELYISDGTEAGTYMLKDINPGSGNGDPKRFVEFNGALFFNAEGPNGHELYTTDGTEMGTVEVVDLNLNGDSNPDEIAVVGNDLYFFASDNDADYDLYKSDGTETGTVKVYDFNAASNTVNTNYVVLNGVIYFAADGDGDGERELWMTDGTEAGTVNVVTFTASTLNPIDVSDIKEMNGKLYFTGMEDLGEQLYSFDPAVLGAEDVENTALEMTISPNPVKDFFMISNIEKGNYTIFDMNGKLVQKGVFTGGEAIESQLDKGIYLIQVESNGNTLSEKLIVR